MKDSQNTEMIDAYLLGQLSESQKEEFDSLMENNPEFRLSVENASAAFDVIKIEGREELRKELKKIHSEMKPVQKRNSFSLSLKLAAIFVGVFAIGTLLWNSLSNEYNYGQLYADNFEPYTNLLTVKGETTATDEQSLINNAMYQYDLKDYQKANLSFQRLLDIKKNNDTVLFYYGISKLGSGDSESAIDLLSQLNKNESSLFSRFGHVKWYLALAYLKKIDQLSTDKNNASTEVDYYLEKCGNLLKEIIKDNGDYSEEATKILKNLK